MDRIILLALAGFFAGLHSASWGAYKDSLYESFSVKSFLRSLVFGVLLTFFAVFFLKWEGITAINLGVLYAMVMLLERALTEGIKAYLREESQDKYKIPSRVHMLGRVVEGKMERTVTGFVFSLGFVLFTLFVFNTSGMISNVLLAGLLSGLTGGLLIAVGGCLKDAPIEGFNLLKFIRSPMIATIAGVLFSGYASSHGVLMLSAMGIERMITEFYKTFLEKTAPGKFKASKPVYVDWLKRRRILVFPYVLTWLAFLTFFAFNLSL